MATVSVVDPRVKASLEIVTDTSEGELVRIYRAMTPEQRAAINVLMRGVVAASRAAPWAGWRGARA